MQLCVADWCGVNLRNQETGGGILQFLREAGDREARGQVVGQIGLGVLGRERLGERACRQLRKSLGVGDRSLPNRDGHSETAHWPDRALSGKVEATNGFEPVNRGFAGITVASADVREVRLGA